MFTVPQCRTAIYYSVPLRASIASDVERLVMVFRPHFWVVFMHSCLNSGVGFSRDLDTLNKLVSKLGPGKLVGAVYWKTLAPVQVSPNMPLPKRVLCVPCHNQVSVWGLPRTWSVGMFSVYVQFYDFSRGFVFAGGGSGDTWSSEY